MAALWSLKARYEAWLEVEIAVCQAWTEQGRIPQDALDHIRRTARIDVDRILEIETVTRHDVIAFITQLEETVGEPARFIHLGCTSSDIVDVANALLLTRAARIIDEAFESVLAALKGLSQSLKGVLCMGRTHGMHAEPTSMGLKFATFFAEFTRRRETFRIAAEGVRVGKISGAVGTYAFLNPTLEHRALELLGLEVDPVSTQIIQRDRYAQYFSALGLLGGSVERLCTELRHLQRTELAEVEEGFAKGQKGSSAMPHKKNPISAENLCGLSRLLRTNALAAMENQALWHERDISHSSVERVIMPDSTILADYILHRLTGLLSGLGVRRDNVERNLNASFGLYFSQRVLTALIEAGTPRQKAYETVQRIAMTAWNEKRSFPDLVLADDALRGLLPESQLSGLFDPMFYLQYETEILDRVFGPHGGGAS